MMMSEPQPAWHRQNSAKTCGHCGIVSDTFWSWQSGFTICAVMQTAVHA